MRRSAFFQRPAARAFMVAVAAGGALLPIVGVASAAPPAGTGHIVSMDVTATGTALTASPASTVAQGTPVTLTAVVTPATATGTVQFTGGTTAVGTPGTVTNGIASVTTSTLAVGAHQLTAVFTPADPAAYTPSTSPTVQLAVMGAGGGAPQTPTPQPQQSGQSLDEQPIPLDLAPAGPALALPAGPLGVPGVMLEAYQRAERTMAETQPGCHLSHTLLAAIGRIESGHAGGGRVDAAGNTVGPIRGQQLNGAQSAAAISDTDQGALDGDATWDRAVGPMQFIPASWRRYGVGDPNNIYDSTLAAGRYLCAEDTDLSDPNQQRAAVFRYNHSAAYVATVLQWMVAYQTGVLPTPIAPGLAPVTGNDSVLPRTVASPRTVAKSQPAPVVADLDATVADLDASPATAPTAQSLDY
ncbi:MAG TPA: Ig-like domain repeat protein [Pseudonocardiaceae bacterium]|nr:Ig-like domain repeat protein [Pseudonocardiaceae bacterium]